MNEQHSHHHQQQEEQAHHQAHHHVGGTLGTASHATLHCLMGCAAGEILGVVIGTAVGWGVWGRMGLGTLLAFVFGLNFAALPLVRREMMPFFKAMKTIFWGEVASIIAMEIAMNAADYWFGGAQAYFSDWRYWVGFLVMLPAGYIVALPVNYILIKTAVKDASHH